MQEKLWSRYRMKANAVFKIHQMGTDYAGNNYADN